MSSNKTLTGITALGITALSRLASDVPIAQELQRTALAYARSRKSLGIEVVELN